MVTNSAVRNHEAISAEFGRGKINSDEPCSFRDAFKLRVSISISRMRGSQHRQTERSRSGRRYAVRIGHIFGDGCSASGIESGTHLAHQSRACWRVETVQEISNQGQIIAVTELGLEGAAWDKVVPITNAHRIPFFCATSRTFSQSEA